MKHLASFEWKAQVELESSLKLKVLRTDNGGEYTSTEFNEYLKREGIKHELSVPKNPEQNGVAERFNRTLIEAVRAMLSSSSCESLTQRVGNSC